MLWLKKGFGFAGEWTVRRQNELLALCFRLQLDNNPFCNEPFVVNPSLRSFAGTRFCSWSAHEHARHQME
jgi:hypothetical protein